MKFLKVIYLLYSKLPKILCVILPDHLEVKRLFYRCYGYFPDLDNPKIFDEKIQWYKLNYRKPIMNVMADKFEVRDFVTKLGLEYLLNELYGVYDSVEEINFNSLPNQFVLKGTHGCAMNLICKNKDELNWDSSKKEMRKWLKTNIYSRGRPWVYKDIKPRLICEKYLENEEYHELIDYKFYCYGGKPEVVFVCAGRFSESGVKYDAYDMNWNYIPAFKGKESTKLNFKRPKEFEDMIDIAAILSQGFPFLRVDLYLVKESIIFSELTFYPDNGFASFTPDHYNYSFGNWFKLSSN